ncbi:hypothetical protein CPB86DRAFT_289514 [Serendipita vermifera]|nr:hypothetical protein CPB86DRAFT_289514 [Serendipita vermifera]
MTSSLPALPTCRSDGASARQSSVYRMCVFLSFIPVNRKMKHLFAYLATFVISSEQAPFLNFASRILLHHVTFELVIAQFMYGMSTSGSSPRGAGCRAAGSAGRVGQFLMQKIGQIEPLNRCMVITVTAHHYCGLESCGRIRIQKSRPITLF